jgi:predicted transcriptional regulator
MEVNGLDVPYVKMNEEGLQRFFGPLEAKIMDIIWSSPSDRMTIKEVNTRLTTDQELSFNTVMTIMNRLTEKEHLIKINHPSNKKITYYKPRVSKDEFVHAQTGAVTQMLFRDFGDHAVTHMMDALDDADPELLNKLEHKLNELKRRKGRSDDSD